MQRINFFSCLIGGLVAAVVFAGSAMADQIITLRSGNGSVGGVDSDISMLIGPLDTVFGDAFTPTDFANARTGPQASIVSPHGAWVPPPSFSDPSAQYISTNASASHASLGNGASALFAIDFTITDAAIASASIVFSFLADNGIGSNLGGPNEGLFLNGAALSGSTFGGHFTSESTITRNDIAPLLTTGLNTLYINMADVGGPSGIMTINRISALGAVAGAILFSASASANVIDIDFNAGVDPFGNSQGELRFVGIDGFPVIFTDDDSNGPDGGDADGCISPTPISGTSTPISGTSRSAPRPISFSAPATILIPPATSTTPAALSRTSTRARPWSASTIPMTTAR